RVYWAQVYLQKAGLVVRPARGRYQVTDTGREVLGKKPERVDIKFLNQFSSFQKFKSLSHANAGKEPAKTVAADTNADPLEELEASYEKMKAAVCDELLNQARELDPTD